MERALLITLRPDLDTSPVCLNTVGPIPPHLRPLPGQTRRGLPLIEERLGRRREQGVPEEDTSMQAGPPQLVELLTLETVNGFWHHGWRGQRHREKVW